MADILALSAMKSISESLETAYNNGKDLEARTNMSFASNIAGIAFNQAFVHVGHAIAHEFGVQFHMQHGIACALTLPEVIAFSAKPAPERMLKIAEALGVPLKPGTGGVEAGAVIAESLRAMMRRLNIPSLKAQGITKESAVACSHNAILHIGFVVFALKPVTDDVMADVIGKIYDNYQ
jgi:alcohol dehydrogenase class IV